MEGSDTCYAHSGALAAQSRKAALRSAEVRKAKAEARKTASEDAKLSLTDAIRRAAAVHRDELVESLVKAAKADGSSRAMAELLNRVDGKVTDSLNVQAGDPFTMDEAALHKWLSEAADETVVETPHG